MFINSITHCHKDVSYPQTGNRFNISSIPKGSGFKEKANDQEYSSEKEKGMRACTAKHQNY